MATAPPAPGRELDDPQAILGPGHTFGTVTDKISDVVLTPKFPKGWVLAFMATFAMVNMLLFAVAYLISTGIGIWGNNIPVGWAFDITNFVWWIGIGHAGTLISAILLLLNQKWRTSINRFAEAMTLFAVICAGMFPLIHMGRPWYGAYWLLPIPGNTMRLWPQFRSPLIWDVFAVSTYLTVSFIFWYVGLIPDFGTLRDKARNWYTKVTFGVLSMGWRGAARHWHRYEIAYLLLAGLATPLVVSVHTVVSFDFAVSILPGWHTTIFPPYFVAGAIYSGFAMVLTLAIPIRAAYGMQDLITMKHLDNMAKVMLATGLVVAYGYTVEAFMSFYSANTFEVYVMKNRFHGPFNFQYWLLIASNVITPQFLWFPAVRRRPVILFVLSLIINLGMWLERYVIIVLSLSRDFLPSSWGRFAGTQWDWMTYFGTLGLFFCLMIVFCRLLPMISIFEVRMLLPEARAHMNGHADGHAAGHAGRTDLARAVDQVEGGRHDH
jgi:molybdopterin-containing oxidoreductase family membrane subunit